MSGFDGIQRGKYFGGEQLGELRVGNLKNGKAGGEDEVIGEMVKDGGDIQGY